LRDEGIIYAMRLMEAGVCVELHSYPGTFHGSALVPGAAVSKRGNEELMVALRRGLRVDEA
jgi:acetyl esterase/lipase